tara:strand:- start:84 stop:191 length:108 start_codon:yes stop_codon:yes gene_type:complete
LVVEWTIALVKEKDGLVSSMETDEICLEVVLLVAS